jgi:hypothetical protein
MARRARLAMISDYVAPDWPSLFVEVEEFILDLERFDRGANSPSSRPGV